LPPGWAAGSGTELAPGHFADYEAFAAAVAARYGVGGSFWAANPQLPYLPIEQFEIWDEANSDNFWIYIPNNAWTNADAAAYAQLLIPTSSRDPRGRPDRPGPPKHRLAQRRKLRQPALQRTASKELDPRRRTPPLRSRRKQHRRHRPKE
jgi:hypothetical protein